MPAATPSEAKLREAILYLAMKSEADPRFGKTKLYKQLFYADFGMHARYGYPITGVNYVRLPHGPAPEGRAILEDMVSDGDLIVVVRNHFGREQLRPTARRPANVGVFTAEELDMLQETVEALWDRSARDVSDLSHDFLGWQVAVNHEVIPYDTVFLDTGPATEDEETFARDLVAAGR